MDLSFQDTFFSVSAVSNNSLLYKHRCDSLFSALLYSSLVIIVTAIEKSQVIEQVLIIKGLLGDIDIMVMGGGFGFKRTRKNKVSRYFYS